MIIFILIIIILKVIYHTKKDKKDSIKNNA